MAIDFWEMQRKRRIKSLLFLFLFLFMTLLIGVLAETIVRFFISDEYRESFPVVAALFTLITFMVAGFNYLMYRSQGGAFVAKSVGARIPSIQNFKEQQLKNIVEEMSIAASIPTPEIFVLEAPAINAFAAGLTQQKAAITVTTGALNQLSREELQGVVAHECGHIANGDIRLSLQVAAMITGFFVLLYLSFRTLDIFRFSRDSKKGNPIIIIALVLLIAGSIAWLGGSLLKALISQQREYLADASGVQYTRNPEGLIGALKKIQIEANRTMPKYGKPYEHLYFDHPSFSSWFSSHPPLEKRIHILSDQIK